MCLCVPLAHLRDCCQRRVRGMLTVVDGGQRKTWHWERSQRQDQYRDNPAAHCFRAIQHGDEIYQKFDHPAHFPGSGM